MKDQYVLWESMIEMRKFWIAHGHDNVPDPECSCEFKGKDKPVVCAYHNKVGD